MSRDRYLRTADPEKDAEVYSNREAKTIGECSCCHEPIYEYEDHYNIDDEILLHDDCGLDWLQQFKKYV